ncbi:MAG: cell division protein FtsQ/DivIB [Lachnospirales bacterium]
MKNLKEKTFVILVLLMILAIVVMALPVFNIKTVVINGRSKLTEDEVYLDIFDKDTVNIFTVNTREYEKRLVSYPYVKSADVYRNLPNELVIDITERKCIGYAMYGDGIYVHLDSEGVVLDLSNSIEEIHPVFTNLNIKEAVKGQELSTYDEKVFSKAVSLANAFKLYDFGDKVININLGDLNDIVITINNIKVLFGSTEEINTKMTWINAIVNEELTYETAGTLDLRYPERNPVFSEDM